MTDKKKKKLKSIASKGAKGFNPNKMPMGGDNNYREKGDLDESRIVDVPTITVKGVGHMQGNTSAVMWGRYLNGSGLAPGGSYFRHQGKIYKSSSPNANTSTQIKF